MKGCNSLCISVRSLPGATRAPTGSGIVNKNLNNLNSVKGNVSKAVSNPKGYRHQINRAIKTHQVTTRTAVKSTSKSFAKASFFSNFVGKVKSFFGW